MQNLGRTLQKNGCSFDDVVKVTVYLKRMEDYQEMNAVYRTFFTRSYPARECVGGLEIAFGSDLEISAIAYKRHRTTVHKDDDGSANAGKLLATYRARASIDRPDRYSPP